MKFHETGYGRRFFEKQIPDLLKTLGRIADALETANDIERKQLKQKRYETHKRTSRIRD